MHQVLVKLMKLLVEKNTLSIHLILITEKKERRILNDIEDEKI